MQAPAGTAASPGSPELPGYRLLLKVPLDLARPSGIASLESVAAAPADFPAGETAQDLATRKANGGEILVLVPGKRAVRVYVPKEAAADG